MFGSVFKLKIKAIRYASYNELKDKTYTETEEYTYSKLGGK